MKKLITFGLIALIGTVSVFADYWRTAWYHHAWEETYGSECYHRKPDAPDTVYTKLTTDIEGLQVEVAMLNLAYQTREEGYRIANTIYVPISVVTTLIGNSNKHYLDEYKFFVANISGGSAIRIVLSRVNKHTFKIDLQVYDNTYTSVGEYVDDLVAADDLISNVILKNWEEGLEAYNKVAIYIK